MNPVVVVVAEMMQGETTDFPLMDPCSNNVCYKSDSMNDLVKDYLQQRKKSPNDQLQEPCKKVLCFWCGGMGHIAHDCPGMMSVPPSSLGSM